MLLDGGEKNKMITNKYEATLWNVYQYGFYTDFIKIERETINNKEHMILKNYATGEIIKGLNKINDYLLSKKMKAVRN